MKKISESQANIGPVRLSYLNVFKARANDLKNGAKEFSVTLLFPKDNCDEQPNAKEEIAAVRKLLKDAVFAKWGENPPAKLRNPIRDGDDEVDAQGEPKAPGYYFLNVSAKEEYPPLLIDGSRKVVTGGWQSGDWGIVQVSVFAYDTRGNRGVSAGLRAIQFISHGDSLGGGGSVTPDSFDEVAKPAGATSGSPSDDYDPFADE